ncbi:hypothetical protein NC653_031716 [Populus alba x Populus x berolinensis]|uniref:Uncharacterized protein n=1 Tax=Populus alba x Populus x berolinensis TaxID=444605 RepID=A0AAD6LZH3_9ROSI|nr:hypothetical protein NC653_031716 [Populus alba x Populus x berolinensis]
MPSGLPWVLKPVKKDNNLFSSLLTSRYKKRQPSSKLDGNLGYAERGNSPEAGRKKSRPVRMDYKRVNVSKASASRRVR